jgi:hypothetical protein
MEDFLQVFLQKHQNPPALCLFFLGYLQAKTKLPASIITGLLEKVYFSGFSSEKVEELEDFLFQCNLKSLSESLNFPKKTEKILISSSRNQICLNKNNSTESLNLDLVDYCFLCKKKTDKEILYISCVHSFHRPCIVDYLSNLIDRNKPLLCPECGKEVRDILDIDSSLIQKIRKNTSESLEGKLVYCEIYKQVYEIEPSQKSVCSQCKHELQDVNLLSNSFK